MESGFPILEFDPSPGAIIEPSRVTQRLDVPEHCVPCFFRDVVQKVAESRHANVLLAKPGFQLLKRVKKAVGGRKAKVLAEHKWEHGSHLLYEIEVEGKRLAFYQAGVGAPLSAGLFEEVIARGCRKFIACGGAGVLDREIAVGHVIVPSAAVRDEGTSYHYLAPSREVAASPEGVAAIETVLKKHGVDYLVGKTWTTDAPYRETPEMVRRRRAEGCLTVEMEAAAFFAVAQFRGVTFAQLLYGGDDVSGSDWDHRDWWHRASTREKLFWLAAEACLSL